MLTKIPFLYTQPEKKTLLLNSEYFWYKCKKTLAKFVQIGNKEFKISLYIWW